MSLLLPLQQCGEKKTERAGMRAKWNTSIQTTTTHFGVFKTHVGYKPIEIDLSDFEIKQKRASNKEKNAQADTHTLNTMSNTMTSSGIKLFKI